MDRETSYIEPLGSQIGTSVDFDTFIIPLNGPCDVFPVNMLMGGGNIPAAPGGAFFRVGENFSPVPFRLPMGCLFRVENSPLATCVGFIVERRKRVSVENG